MNQAQLGLLMQMGAVIGVFLATGALVWGELHPKSYDQGWNACVDQIRATNPASVWPMWVQNLSGNWSNATTHTPDTDSDDGSRS